MLERVEELEKRYQELERQIAELKVRWPAHSVPPRMLQELEELEEELETELKKADAEPDEMEVDGGSLSNRAGTD